ncbi:MAG: hypothetical protein IH987_09530, partial [Planctomycetes bacterium]|nr:hypothetical protein [Planctomycetota bacterium]
LALSVDEAQTWFFALDGQDAEALTELQADYLTGLGQDAERAYDRNLATVRSAVKTGLAPLAADPPDTSAIESQLAEEMHFAFIEGSEDRVGQIKEAVDTIKAYNGKVKTVAEWASRVARAAGAAKTLGALKHVVGGASAISNVLSKVSNVLTAAKSLTTIAGLDNQAVGEAQNSINQFEQAIAAIDLARGFAIALMIVSHAVSGLLG